MQKPQKRTGARRRGKKERCARVEEERREAALSLEEVRPGRLQVQPAARAGHGPPRNGGAKMGVANRPSKLLLFTFARSTASSRLLSRKADPAPMQTSKEGPTSPTHARRTSSTLSPLPRASTRPLAAALALHRVEHIFVHAVEPSSTAREGEGAEGSGPRRSPASLLASSPSCRRPRNLLRRTAALAQQEACKRRSSAGSRYQVSSSPV